MKNWTVNAMETLQKAQGKAYEMSHFELTPLHLLWAMLSETGLVQSTVKTLELDPNLISRTAENELSQGKFRPPAKSSRNSFWKPRKRRVRGAWSALGNCLWPWPKTVAAPGRC